MIGKLISHYKILKKLGEGGMGIVYKAEDTKLKRVVALKFLPQHLTVNKTDQARFLQEAQAAAAINHPNVCIIYDIQEHEGQQFIVMEYVEGKTLRNIVGTRGEMPMKIDDVLNYTIQIAKGLSVAHDKGIVHRDIKSANIMVTETGQIKIMDFGLAKVGEGADLTKDHSTVGTLAYMSPEQIQGQTVDALTDIFSFGVVLFEMLTGQLPFRGDYESAMMYSILNEEPKETKSLCQNCPDYLEDIIGKCLQKEAENRFGLMQEIIQAIEKQLPVSKPETSQLAKHNLPGYLTSFIGREKEIETVKELLSDHRLVTLTGAGGCGKTRLSQQIAIEITDNYDDGVWLVELASLSDGQRIPEVIASALQVKVEAQTPIVDTITKTIKDKNLLLLLDNCEHLISACSDIVEQLLKTAKNLTLLATSREALNIQGELAWRVPSLSVPKSDQALQAKDTSQFESITLFVDRAKNNNPSFGISNQNIDTIAKICSRLDGIPLAIELAAARIKLFSPGTILNRLDDRFQLLTGGSRTALERQKTLRATIDWSYELLSDEEKILFNRLSVFIGGCDMEAVEDICGIKPLTKENIFELMSSLIDKSLVVTETNKDGTYRYRLLETIRHYGREKLLEANESRSIRERHFKYFLELAEKAYINHVGEEATWGNRLELEHENLIAALDWVTEKPKLLLQLAGALFWFWRVRAHFSIGFRYLENVLTRYDNRDSIYARGLSGYGLLLSILGDFDNGLIWFNKGLELWRDLGDQREIGFLLTYMGMLYLHFTTEYTKGLECTSEAVDTLEKCNDPKLLLRAKLWNAYGFISQFQPDEAEPLVLEISKSAKALKMQWDPLIAQHMYGDCAIMKENYVESEKRYGDAVRLGFKIGDIQQTAYDMQGVAMSLAGQRKFKKALLLNGAAVAKCEALGASPESIIFWSKLISKTIGQARIELGEKAADEFEQKGRQMEFEKAVEYALDLELD